MRDFYLAEGTIRSGFSEQIAVLNPTTASGTAQILFMFPGGATHSMDLPVQPKNRRTVDLAGVPQVVALGPDVSAKVTVPQGWVAERQMFFSDARGWTGGTDKVGAPGPSTTWYFAEGTTLPGFTEFLTFQNPNAAPVTVTLTYQPEGCSIPGGVVRSFSVAGYARDTLQVPDPSDPRGARGAVCTGLGSRVTSTLPVVVERPLYFSKQFPMGEVSDGHVAFGVTAPSTSWYFAEGTTLGSFQEYVTVANPGAVAASLTLQYQLIGEGPVVKSASVPPGQRHTIDVASAFQGVGPGKVGVSLYLSSTQPVVAERPLYVNNDWGFGRIGGGHDVVGATAPGNSFGFATGRLGAQFREYLTLQNPGAEDTSATIAYIPSAGDSLFGSPVIRAVDLPASSRVNVEVFGPAQQGGVGTLAGGTEREIATTVYAAKPILVERPIYFVSGESTGATDAVGDSEVTPVVGPPSPVGCGPSGGIPTDWLGRLNAYRAIACLPPVSENASWSYGAWLHSRYMVKNDVLVHDEDPGWPWYTAEGDDAGNNSNVAAATSSTFPDSQAIDMWTEGPFHAAGLFRGGFLSTGYGAHREADGGYQTGATLDIIRGLGTPPPEVSYPIRWPGDGSVAPLRQYSGGEYPDPLSSCPGYSTPTGLPVLIAIGSSGSGTLGSHSLLKDGVPSEHCVYDWTTYTNSNPSYQAQGRSVLAYEKVAVLIPRYPLTSGSTYTVSMQMGSQTHNWSFSA